MDMRCTQLFEPRLAMFRYRPSPSEYLAGLLRLVTFAVVNLFIFSSFPTLFPQYEWDVQDLEGTGRTVKVG